MSLFSKVLSARAAAPSKILLNFSHEIESIAAASANNTAMLESLTTHFEALLKEIVTPSLMIGIEGKVLSASKARLARNDKANSTASRAISSHTLPTIK